MVKKQVKTHAFSQLTEECSYDRKTWHLKFETFHLSAYLALLPPDVARVTLKARLRMLDLKVNFKKKYDHNLLIVHFAVQNQRSLITFFYVPSWHLYTKINSINKGRNVGYYF